MRNLSVTEVKRCQLDVEPGEKIAVICYGHSEGCASGKLYFCSHNLYVTNYDEYNAKAWCESIAGVSGVDNHPVDIVYLTLQDSLCVALGNGELINLSADGSRYECVGLCSDGLLAAEWSPDQELLVLVTKELKAILMSYTYDPMNEVSLLEEEFGEKQFITVGWGKKETQFHGSEGKNARVKNEVLPDPNAKSEDDIKITWRGDGQLYAIGFAHEGIRRFKVFDREGNLQYTSEKQTGLESNLSWRPSGNVIATTQKLPDKYLLAFFEKNGLKHGEFTIPVNDTTFVQDILWSYDSEILAIKCFDSSDGTYKVMMFTSSNYHWYLKQTLLFDSQVTKIMWDNDFDVANNKKLHVILDDGKYYSYNWVWTVDHSQGQTDADDAVVAVIDGQQILLTGFRQTVIPPPMAALTLQLQSQINSIHFYNDQNSSNSFFVSTSDFKIIFYRQTNKHPLVYEELNTILLDKYDFPFQLHNWQWINEDSIACIKVEKNYSIVEFEIKDNRLVTKASTLLPASVLRIQAHPKKADKIFLQLNNGEIIEYTSGGEISPLQVYFPTQCPRFEVVYLGNQMHFLGLSSKNNFYIDDSLVLPNVNSFYVHTHFLLLTTMNHWIMTAELTEIGLNALKDYKKNESQHVYKRKVERGSRLVVAVANETRTILQMPRGNLEAIQPRPLSLKIIGKHLDNLKYYDAFDLMRKQRINLNLIHDHNPEKFLHNIEEFLECIKNNSWLSLFLSDLENTDVTKTMYSSSYAESNSTSQDGAKVERICNVFRECISKRDDSSTKVLPLITTYVKANSVESLETALDTIKKMKDQESGGSKLPVGSDEALKYLLYMVDVNKLFDIALGMYDFDLVLLVANKSQKDPKEYVSMLNEFNEMEENYKRFSINKHLKRFDRAVQCLSKCGPDKHEELRSFVKFHSLYNHALRLFEPNETIFTDISEDYGSYLRLQKQYLEAGFIYRRSKNYEKAIECFKDVVEWELAIEVAINYLDNDKFLELCWELVSALKEKKSHQKALMLLERYCGNNKEAILYAVDVGYYRSALRLCNQYKEYEFIDKNIKPKLLEDYESLNSIIESNWCTLVRHRDRLRIARENKKKVSVNYDPCQDTQDCDLYSDAGSTVASSASRSSSRTYRSSKNRRKHERKVASLKEGSQYEDVALVMALHGLVTSSFELRSQVHEVNVALVCLEMDKEASVLQRGLDKLLKDMKDSFKDIWTNELVLEATNASVAALDVPEGCSVVLQGIATLEPHMRIAPVIHDIKWKLEGLEF